MVGSAQILANGVGPQRQRQAGFVRATIAPRSTTSVQSPVAVGQLPLVNDQARVDRLALDTVLLPPTR